MYIKYILNYTFIMNNS